MSEIKMREIGLSYDVAFNFIANRRVINLDFEGGQTAALLLKDTAFVERWMEERGYTRAFLENDFATTYINLPVNGGVTTGQRGGAKVGRFVPRLGA